MKTQILTSIQSLLLVCALSLDAFVASIGYGANKIKIPFISLTIINLVCSSFLAISLFFGSFIKRFIPGAITSTISCIALMTLGIYYLFESIVKSYIKKKSNSNKRVELKLFDLRFIIDIYADETKADFNNSKDISPREALYLSAALSLDSLAAGFGSSLGNINFMQTIVLSLVFNMFAVIIGSFLGRKFIEKSKINLSWLGGLLLIILAILRTV